MNPILKPIDLSDTANLIAKNVSDKPTKVLGQMFSDLLEIPAAKIHFHSEKNKLNYEAKLKLYKTELNEKILNLSDSKLISPQLQVVGQAIDDSVFCVENDDLRNMFTNLIANACNIDYIKLVHPSFSSIIKQLSPYDALLFNRMAKQDFTQPIEAAEYLILTKDSPDYGLVYECIIYTDGLFSDFEMQSLSVSALKHLGIIELTTPHHSTADARFTKNDFFENLENNFLDTESYPVARPLDVYLTPYGRSFAIACSLHQLSDA